MADSWVLCNFLLNGYNQTRPIIVAISISVNVKTLTFKLTIKSFGMMIVWVWQNFIYNIPFFFMKKELIVRYEFYRFESSVGDLTN